MEEKLGLDSDGEISDEEECDELANDQYGAPKTDNIDEITFLKQQLEGF
jgi:hypothetical protein